MLERAAQPARESTAAPVPSGTLQRACACGQHSGNGGECADCRRKRETTLQRAALTPETQPDAVPSIVQNVLGASGQPLERSTRATMDTRFGHDFSTVRVHTDAQAAESARAVGAQAYTVGRDVVFGAGQYQPHTPTGQHLLAHELAHVVQQRSSPDIAPTRIDASDSAAEQAAERAAALVISGQAAGDGAGMSGVVQRRAAPYIKKITVHLKPPQSAELAWEGTPPADATGSDNFTVSTGKGYSDPGDPRGTCTRACCNDPDTQCAPPWNQPDRVGACCTYYGDSFWTGVPQDEHNGWKWWTPIQPYYSTRGIALHQHDEVTGQPIGHGCVRMDEPNARRIYDYSNGRRTNVTIDGRAAPVACADDRRCTPPAGSGGGGARGATEGGPGDTALAQATEEPVPGLEGELT